MQATTASSNNLRTRLTEASTTFSKGVILLAAFLILAWGWDLVAWAVTCAWTHNFDSAPWRGGGWWAWRNGITSPTLQLLLAYFSLGAFMAACDIRLRYYSPWGLLAVPTYLLFGVLALAGIAGVAAFALSWVFPLFDQLLAWIGIGRLF